MATVNGSDYTSSSGNSSFRVQCDYEISINARGNKTVTYNYYVHVTKGDFEGTTLVTSWNGNITINGIGVYGRKGGSFTVIAGGSAGSIPSANAYYLGNADRISTLKAIPISANAITSYKHAISHYLIGFNGETGTLESPNENHYLLGEDSVSIQYGNSIDINDYIANIPKGFHLTRVWVDSENYYQDSNNIYTQDSNSTNLFHYYYDLNIYNITYNLDGGVNSSENPTNYNVLYGKDLINPTRENYTFVHWVDQDNNVVTGINEGCNAEFSSVDEMYNQLASRTIGDLTLTAVWKVDTTIRVNDGESFKHGKTRVNVANSWEVGIPWINVANEWKKGGV